MAGLLQKITVTFSWISFPVKILVLNSNKCTFMDLCNIIFKAIYVSCVEDPNSVKLLLSASNRLFPSSYSPSRLSSLLFTVALFGELASLRRRQGADGFSLLWIIQMIRGKVRQRGVVGAAGHPFTPITIPISSTRGKSS